MRARDVFRFWLPLFASWALMMAEGPILSGAVNRLPDEVVMLAALGIVFSLEVLLESPIMNMLATGTALVRDRASFVMVRRFTVHWMLLLTALSALLVWRPVFDLVVLRAMGTPADVARWVRPGLAIMVLWSAAIAWRRFLQGVLIQLGHGRQMAIGTAIRLAASGGSAVLLALWGGWPGIYLGATALMIGVSAEAVYVTLVARPVLRRELADDDPSEEPLTYRALLAFHMPLAGTSVLTLLAQPLITGTLARLDRPTLTLAAWPLIFQLMLILRSPALAVPETVIALGRRPGARRAVDRFSLALAAVSLGVTALFTATPLVDLYYVDAQSAAPEVAEMAAWGALMLVPLPAMTVLIMWLRGHLMERRRTNPVNAANAVRLVSLAAFLGVGLLLDWPGLVTAALALNLANLLELGYLARKTPRAEA